MDSTARALGRRALCFMVVLGAVAAAVGDDSLFSGPFPDRCGPGVGDCAKGECCSVYGYCGTTVEHCAPLYGCQQQCWPACGDSICDAGSYGKNGVETCSSCPADCGFCAEPVCGDGKVWLLCASCPRPLPPPPPTGPRLVVATILITWSRDEGWITFEGGGALWDGCQGGGRGEGAPTAKPGEALFFSNSCCFVTVPAHPPARPLSLPTSPRPFPVPCPLTMRSPFYNHVIVPALLI